MKRLLYGILLLSALCGCEPGTDLDTLDYTPKLVVDGSIENGGYARVVLSYSASYFDNIDSASIRKLLVTTAKVTVSNGQQEEILTLKRDNKFFPPYLYAGTSLKGEPGKTYHLKVELKGQTYTATTTIPPPAKFNDLWYELAPKKDSAGYIFGKLTDDPAVNNYYRVFTQRKDVDDRYIPVYLSAVGDQYFNGKTFTFSILRGPENFTDPQDDLYFQLGDTVRIKFCTMDKAHFDFWRTVERELYVVGNPFASSGNEILSNIEGKNVLGVWGGYGVTYYQIVAKPR
jgi:hypothetical protein